MRSIRTEILLPREDLDRFKAVANKRGFESLSAFIRYGALLAEKLPIEDDKLLARASLK